MTVDRKVSSIEASFKMESMPFDTECRKRVRDVLVNYFKYEVVLQGNRFIAAMSVDEVAESAKLTVDILEELKNINNSGINRDELKRIEKEEDRHETDGDNVMQILGIWNSIKTEQLLELISKLDRVRRV